MLCKPWDHRKLVLESSKACSITRRCFYCLYAGKFVMFCYNREAVKGLSKKWCRETNPCMVLCRSGIGTRVALFDHKYSFIIIAYE